MRVLLVDDEHELASTLAERLSIRNIEADWATGGEDALRLAEEKTFDIAVLDVKIPRISGFELKKRLHKKCPDLKFIFMTGHGSAAAFKAGAAEAGPENYLTKPVNIDTLIKKMNDVLTS